MIDLSDGLSSDIGHICDQSQAGVRLWGERLPISDATRSLAARMERVAGAWALEGGEDYELCFTAPAEVHEELSARVRDATGTTVTCVGEVLPRTEGRWVRVASGEEKPLTAAGWDHFGGVT